MPFAGLFVYAIVSIFFGWFLYTIGKRMYAITSYKQSVLDYRKNPKKADWFVKYYLGYAFWNDSFMLWMIDIMGDRITTLFYRTSGIFFLVAGIAAWGSVPLIILLNFL